MASAAARFKASLEEEDEDNASRHSLDAPTLPPYSEYPPDTDIKLPNLTPSTSSNSLGTITAASQPPPEIVARPFNPTIQLQVQTDGKRWLSLPLPPKPVPIPIFSVSPDGQHLVHNNSHPLYLSLRPTRSSGSSYLVRGDYNHDEAETPPSPLTTTTYRFGLGRSPTVELLPSRSSSSSSFSSSPADEGKESIEIRSKSALSRAMEFTSRTLGGTFAWRYAGSKERSIVNADSLLVLERLLEEDDDNSDNNNAEQVVATNATDDAKKGKKRDSQPKREKKGTTIGHFIRNAEFRTPGTTARTAGNGGRLMLDLSTFRDEEGGRGEKERVQLLVVTTVLVMLKKEVDRRRTAQIAIMCAAAGGGGAA